MRKWLVQAAVAFAVAGGLVGCTTQPEPTYSNSAGSLAISRDDALLFAVDQDNEVVSILDGKTQQKVTDVKVGKAPERIIASPDNTLYISNRGSRSVSVVKQLDGTWQETAKVDVGVEPVGLALAPAGDVLYVVNSTALDATDHGTLMAIDTRTNQVKWDLPVGEEPRGVALIDGGKKALVSLYKKGDVVTVDLESHSVVKATPANDKSAIYQAANKSKDNAANVPYGYSPTGVGGISTFQPRAAADVVTTPDGTRAFVPVVWSREDAINAKPSVFGGYYGSGGPCNLGAIATPGLVTIDATTSEPLVDDLTACSYSTNTDTADFPPSTIGPPSTTGLTPIQGPVTGVVDPTGEWLYVVNRETNNVAIMPTGRRTGDGLSFGTTGSTVWKLVNVGAAPTGIALSHDGKRAFVHNQFDHSISVLEGRGEGSTATVVRVDMHPSPDDDGKVDDAKFLDDVLPADVVEGRKLFFSGWDSRMTSLSTGVACNTCHVEGREDGHVWVFPDGPRQTPALAGRMLAKTAPYHWSGEFATIQDFLDHTVRLRMGGSEISPAMTQQLMAYLAWQPPADNPFKTSQLTAKELHGAQVFQQAGCNSCHSGETLTNNGDFDVGTFVTSTAKGAHVDNTTVVKALNVPSLLGLARTAPYLHDGSAGTLQQRLRNNVNDKHGITSNLSDADMDDLVAYLQTL